MLKLSDTNLIDQYGIYGKNESCTKPSYGKRGKGSGCWVNEDCYSEKCSSNKVCEAVEKYGKCTNHNECDKVINLLIINIKGIIM